MPKYVWELSAILPADESLNLLELDALAIVLRNEIRRWLLLMRHERLEVNFDEPFEHVAGDMLPPDENGVVKIGPSRSIDL